MEEGELGVKPGTALSGKEQVENKGFKKDTGSSKVQPGVSITKFVPAFSSSLEDRKWAQSSMVASIVEGESALALQQRVEDAGFNQMVVTPMGGSSFSSL